MTHIVRHIVRILDTNLENALTEHVYVNQERLENRRVIRTAELLLRWKVVLNRLEANVLILALDTIVKKQVDVTDSNGIVK